ncbi:aminotransferase class I/II-fold pyridoxal phosphate-dependent enzyme [Roseovarius salis]|uniref:threonine-phosphate decarboxylase n=1 Tax=Roseovarius salis TaxID=3376063 RepID=UPI0037C9AAD8
MTGARDHGGGVDDAAARFGGTRAAWLDLSTGINPVPYDIPPLERGLWTALPDRAAHEALIAAARAFWQVPEGARMLPAPGASSLIARIPALAPPGRVHIPSPTYNEHAAAFAAHGWTESADAPHARVIVHPNNPTGHWYGADDLGAPLTVIDESFADVAPDRSLTRYADREGVIVLKSFGKFWGLAGLRLGFAIGAPRLVERLAQLIGPWPVSGPALRIGAMALNDHPWAHETRARLRGDAERLDTLMRRAGGTLAGGTDLFRLYEVDDAAAWQTRLARHHVWTRIFPYSDRWIRLGLPAPDAWERLERAL